MIRHYRLPTQLATFRDDVVSGLTAHPKAIAPKYFYDARGSELFEQICVLDEYYPTRTELAIMEQSVAEMATLIGPSSRLIEFGSGASTKTRALIRAARPAVYMPIDISDSALSLAADRLHAEFPWLAICNVYGDFAKPLALPAMDEFDARCNVAYFPGSTVGNFTPAEARTFLARVREMIGANGLFLIGVDTKKDKATLDAAYDDARGVTAAFNMNLLIRINRELGGNFDLAKFRHRAFYDEALGRIEMHLESLHDQSVDVADETFRFHRGETIHTEISCKYSVDEFQAMARAAGFAPLKVWLDSVGMFSVHALRVT